MLYVTTLAGEFPGAGAIFSIDPADGTTTQVFGGLFAATGLAIARNGDMYVAMLFPNTILRIPAGGGEPRAVRDDQPAGGAGDREGPPLRDRQRARRARVQAAADPFAPQDLGLRAGPNGKLVRWAL